MNQEQAPWQHTTVLLHEAVQALRADTADGDASAQLNGVIIDGTFGRGGHSRLILQGLSAQGRLVALDRDPEAVAHAQQGAQRIADPRFAIVHARFSELDQVAQQLGIEQVSGVLLDIGVSSPQIDNPARGFSFRYDAPLDMRMDPTRGESAAQFLQRATQAELAEVIREYGEERFAVPIAKALVARRDSARPVSTTAELSEVVARAVKTREPGQDPATRTFQALRIFVNAELEELRQGLNAALRLLAPQGRLAVISFHSLEDRIVKTFIAQHSSQRELDRRSPAALGLVAEPPAPLLPIARIKPSETEIRANPRARSAVLRVAERTDAPCPDLSPVRESKKARASAPTKKAKSASGGGRSPGGRRT